MKKFTLLMLLFISLVSFAQQQEKKIRTYVVTNPSVDVYKGKRSTSEKISNSELETQYIKELDNIMYGNSDYENYLKRTSYNQLSLGHSYHPNLITLGSYPANNGDAADINITELGEDILQKIPLEGLQSNDIIMVYLLVDPAKQTYKRASGVQFEVTIQRSGVTYKKSVFVFTGVPTEYFISSLNYMKNETLIGSTKSTIIHELFHALGFARHANELLPNGESGEYGHIFDIMGGAALSVNLNPAVRDQFNWLNSNIMQTIEAQSSANVTLKPLNSLMVEKKVLKLKSPGSNLNYYIYFTGKDDPYSKLNLQPNYVFGNGWNPKPMSREIASLNDKGIFIVSDDGTNNLIRRHTGNNPNVYAFLAGQEYEDDIIKVSNIQLDEANQSISFNYTFKPTPDTQAPTAPTTLVASNITQTTLKLNWTASTDNIAVTGYDVYRGSTLLGSTTTTSFNVTGLTTGTAYTFTVRAKDAAGNISDASSITVLDGDCVSKGNTAVAAYLKNVTLGAINNTSERNDNRGYSDYTLISTDLARESSQTITLTPQWNFSTIFNSGYGVWIDYNHDKDFNDPGEQIFVKAPSQDPLISTSFTIPASASLGKTKMRVILQLQGTPGPCGTFSFGETEDYSVNIISGVSDSQAPTAPTSLAVSNIAQTTLTLNWTAATDNVGVTAYDVYRGSTLIGSPTTTPFNVTGLTAATAYSFTVRAKDAAGNVSVVSNVVNVTTLAAPDTQAPTIPTSLTSSSIAQTTLTLNWTASTDNVGVIGYDVYRGSTVIGTVNATTFNVIGLTAATAYAFTVKAKDAAGNVSVVSNVVNVTTLAAPDIQVPTIPTGLTSSSITQTTLTLNWTASTDNVGVTGYDVYRGSTVIGTVNATTFNVTGLTAATAYAFTVKAKDAAGNVSAASNVVNATTLTNAGVSYCVSKGNSVADEYIQRVQLGTINNTSDGGTGYSDHTAISTDLSKGTPHKITITPKWPGSKFIEGYGVWIDYNKDGDFTDAGEQVFTKVPSQDTPIVGNFIVPSRAASGATRMRVILRFNANATACGGYDFGETEDYTVNITSGVAARAMATPSFKEEVKLSLYPNPVSNNNLLHVKLTTQGEFSYTIFNMMNTVVGKGIARQGNAIDVSRLSDGVYILQVTSKNKNYTKRFIKN